MPTDNPFTLLYDQLMTGVRKVVSSTLAVHSARPVPDELLTPDQVAERLQVSVRTLESWRRHDKGPPWLNVEGSIRYRSSALEEYLVDSVQ